MILAGTLFLGISSLNASTAQSLHAPLSGFVTDGRVGLEGVSVVIHELNMGVLTDAKGYFEWKQLTPGRYHIHFTYIGFRPVEMDIKIGQEPVVLEIKMTPTLIEIRQVTIEADFLQSGAVQQSLQVEQFDREMFRKQGGASFAAALERIPGLHTISTGIGIAKPVIRGLSFQRVIVRDYGIKQEGQQWGSDHGLELDVFNAERIEIMKGPVSLLYGSDGLGGVIQILPPFIPEEGHHGGEWVGFYGSNNHHWAGSLMLEGRKKDVFYRVRYSQQDYGDLYVVSDSFFYNSYRLPLLNRRLKNTSGREQSFSASAGIIKSRGNVRLTLSRFGQLAGLFPGATGIPRAYELQDDELRRNVDFPRQRVAHWKAILNAKQLIGQGWLHTDVGWQDNRRREEALPHLHGYGPSPDGNLALGLNLQTFTLQSRYHYFIGRQWKMIHGFSGQYQTNRRSGFEFLLSDFTSWQGGLFTYVEKPLREQWFVNGGLRLDAGGFQIQSFQLPIYNEDTLLTGFLDRVSPLERRLVNLSGALGLSYVPSPHINVKLNAARSFRMPVPAEFSVNGIHHGTFRHEQGNPELQQETGWQFDAGVYYHQRIFSWQLSTFAYWFDRYIFLRPTGFFSDLPEAGQVYKYTQSSALHTGFECQAEVHPIADWHIETSLEYIHNLDLETGLPLPFTPPMRWRFSTDYTLPWNTKNWKNSYVGGDIRISAAQKRVDRNEPETPGFQLFSLFAGFDISLSQQTSLKFRFRVENVFNQPYLNHLSRYRILELPEPGRNFILTVSIPFQWKS